MLTIIRQKIIFIFKAIIVKLKNFTEILRVCEQLATLLVALLAYTLKPI